MVAKRKAVAKGKGMLIKKDIKLTAAGQPFLGQGLCIATDKGTPCCGHVVEDAVPYCRQHMKTGDPAVRVAKHPKAGAILITARELPKGYRLALWGRKKKNKDVSAKAKEWAFIIDKGHMLDPTKEKGSMVQYCACPGPSERAAVTPAAGPYKGKNYGSWVFQTLEPLPPSWQVTMQYGDSSKDSEEFFKERGIERCDVGTKAYPALRRRDLHKGSLKTSKEEISPDDKMISTGAQ